MHNSTRKKHLELTHRRIKTETSQDYEPRNYAAFTETKSINSHIRVKTENREFRSPNFSRMNF